LSLIGKCSTSFCTQDYPNEDAQFISNCTLAESHVHVGLYKFNGLWIPHYEKYKWCRKNTWKYFEYL